MSTKLNRNNTNFPLQLLELLKSMPANEYEFLKYYQNITRFYVTKLDDIETGASHISPRGLLIYHTMGMGKSILAAAIAIDLIKERKPIILLTKSLQENMRRSIYKYVNIRREFDPNYSLCTFDQRTLEKWVDENCSFVSMNASNMLKQVGNAVTASAATEEFDTILEKKMGDIVKNISLDGRLLIVDEAHNLFRAIINGSKNAHGLYELIMSAKNIKILFLTGTPISNDPFELSPCFNMLVGKIDGESLLPVNYHDFGKIYIDDVNGKIKNKAKFQNRIFGLVSHVSHLSTKSNIEFPEEKELILEYVNMDADQYAMYQLARDKERDEGNTSGKFSNSLAFKHGIVNLPAMTKPKGHASSTYKVKSRQLGNYCAPNGYRDEKDPLKLPPIDSAKYRRIYKNLEKHSGQLGLLYSQFVGVGGLGTFALYLKQMGWEEFKAPVKVGGADDYNSYLDNIVNQISNNNNGEDLFDALEDDYVGSDENKKKYAIISGEVSTDDREHIKNIFNSADNMHGGQIDLILVSSTGAEGLDLKNIRHVHIMEPYWNMGRIKQIIARAVRNESHIALPENEKNVTPYIYLAVPPEGEKTNDIYPPTTDTELFQEARIDDVINESFTDALKEVSIECLINKESYCRVCAPTNTSLYSHDPNKDILSADNCRPYEEVNIKAKEIIADDKKYYYVPDKNSIYNYKIYVFDNSTDAYRPLSESSDEFAKIIAIIMNG